ncbi:MAG: hypothetical protein IJE59_05510 [Clostridia bacterium]|nr:hypothetical protein [Clostridia bacterium]
MSIEGIKAKAIAVKLGESLRIHNPKDGLENVISFSPEQMPEMTFNFNGAAICFILDKTMYILPFHKEDYVGTLTSSGFKRNSSLYVPLSDGISYPTEEKMKWRLLMEQSRATV